MSTTPFTGRAAPHVVCPTGRDGVAIVGGVEYSGSKPGIVAYSLSHRPARRAFQELCRSLSIDTGDRHVSHVPHSDEDGVDGYTAWECIGGMDSLAALIDAIDNPTGLHCPWFVHPTHRWHLIMSTRIPLSGGGQGVDKPRNTAKPKQKLTVCTVGDDGYYTEMLPDGTTRLARVLGKQDARNPVGYVIPKGRDNPKR